MFFTNENKTIWHMILWHSSGLASWTVCLNYMLWDDVWQADFIASAKENEKQLSCLFSPDNCVFCSLTYGCLPHFHGCCCFLLFKGSNVIFWSVNRCLRVFSYRLTCCSAYKKWLLNWRSYCLHGFFLSVLRFIFVL